MQQIKTFSKIFPGSPCGTGRPFGPILLLYNNHFLIAIDFVTSEVLMKQILSEDIINQYMPTLVNCPLFNKLGENELRGYLHNAKVIVHSYKKK